MAWNTQPHPPPTYYTNTVMPSAEIRQLGFPLYQTFDVVTPASGRPSIDGIWYMDDCTGSGPIYDIWISGSMNSSGIFLIRPGDSIIAGEDTDSIEGGAVSWYRYDVTQVLQSGSITDTQSSGQFRVKYITDTLSVGDQDPCSLYHTYVDQGYGSVASLQVTQIYRQMNTSFLLGE